MILTIVILMVFGIAALAAFAKAAEHAWHEISHETTISDDNPK